MFSCKILLVGGSPYPELFFTSIGQTQLWRREKKSAQFYLARRQWVTRGLWRMKAFYHQGVQGPSRHKNQRQACARTKMQHLCYRVVPCGLVCGFQVGIKITSSYTVLYRPEREITASSNRTRSQTTETTLPIPPVTLHSSSGQILRSC